MLQQKFYHSTIKKAIIAFGNVFNNIYVDRQDASGNVVQTLKVPLTYAPKDKMLARIAGLPDPDIRKNEVIVPRMAFEMLSVMYDPNRKVSLIQKSRSINSTSNTQDNTYAPTPYNIQIALYVYVKNQDDGLRIIEQILPYFNPDYNLSLKAVPELGIVNDLPILLNDITYDDQYEDDFATRRAIIWTLNFTMKLNFYGPVNKTGIIKSVNVDTFSDPALSNRINSYSVEPSPNDVAAGDVTGFTETFTDF